jgi:hypothetical protein
MGVWRVSYLSEPSAETRRVLTVTVDDPESPSIETLVSRLSGGALGIEWTQGRVIRSIEALEHRRSRHRRIVLMALLPALVAALVVVSLVFGGFLGGTVPNSAPDHHPWSAATYTGAVCGTGCFGQPITESFPNGSQVSGSWSAPQPAVVFIHTTNGTICPGGAPSSYGPNGSCSEPGTVSGTFSFTSVGGAVYFTVGSQNPENVSLIGYWYT